MRNVKLLVKSDGAETIPGDVNGDGTFSIADVTALQKWLLAMPDAKPANWSAADFNGDKQLDARDLSLMVGTLMYG